MNKSFGAGLKGFAKNNPVLLIVIFYFVIAIIAVPGFASAYNFQSYFTNIAPLLVVACGVTFTVLNGGIDFSSTSVLALGSVIGSYVMVLSPLAGTPAAVPVGILVMVGLGALVGTVNGLSVVLLKMPSFIATLATMMIGQGVAIMFASNYFETTSLSGLPDGFVALGGADAYTFIPIIIAVVVFLIAHFLLRYTVFGTRVYAIGTNDKTSFVSGMPVKKTIFTLMFLSGLFAGIASVLYTAKNQAGIPSMGDKLFIDIIGSVIIGGTSVLGGSGGVKQTLFGVLFMVLIDNTMNLLGVTWYIISIIKGILIIVTATIIVMNQGADKAKKPKGEKHAQKKEAGGVTNG